MKCLPNNPTVLPAMFLLAAVLSFIFFDDLFDYLLVFAIPIPFVLQATSVGTSVWAANRLYRLQKKPLAATLLSATILANGLLLLFGFSWGMKARYLLLLPHYSSVVSSVLLNPSSTFAETADEGCRVDTGPPIRVAFPRSISLLNRWSALVYDPSGQVMMVNNPEYLRPPDPEVIRIQELFGGTLGHSEHLVGAWYICGFH